MSQNPRSISADASNGDSGVANTIVKLRKGNGEPPLIVMHGGGGFIGYYHHLKNKFRSAIWAIQVTPDTPLDCIENQVNFYFRKIKEQQVHGPYRLASYCATSVISFALALRFERNGDEVIQLATIDHFPLVFLCPTVWLDPYVHDIDDPKTRRVLQEASIKTLQIMCRQEGTSKKLQYAKEIEQAYNGSPPTEFSMVFWNRVAAFLDVVLDHIRRLTAENGITALSASKGDAVTDSLLAWLTQLKVAPTVYVASRGMQAELPAELREDWKDFGASRSMPRSKVIFLDADHYNILANDIMIESLQEGYLHTYAVL